MEAGEGGGEFKKKNLKNQAKKKIEKSLHNSVSLCRRSTEARCEVALNVITM